MSLTRVLQLLGRFPRQRLHHSQQNVSHPEDFTEVLTYITMYNQSSAASSLYDAGRAYTVTG